MNDIWNGLGPFLNHENLSICSEHEKCNSTSWLSKILYFFREITIMRSLAKNVHKVETYWIMILILKIKICRYVKRKIFGFFFMKFL